MSLGKDVIYSRLKLIPPTNVPAEGKDTRERSNQGLDQNLNITKKFEELILQQDAFNVVLPKATAAFMHLSGAFDQSTVRQAGSVAEGTNFARLFDYEVGCLEIEIDLMTVAVQFPERLTRELVYEAGKLDVKNGTVDLIYNRQLFDYAADEYKQFLYSSMIYLKISEGDRLEPGIILNVILKCFAFQLQPLPERSPGSSSLRVVERLSKASKIMSCYVTTNGKTHVISCDFVFVISLGCWPDDIAWEWICRERNWPDNDTVINIVRDGCHLVAKEDATANSRWQITFFNAEITLAKLRTPTQRLAYMLAKAVFYKYIVPLNRKQEKQTRAETLTETQISSYFLKTIMMWKCQDIPPTADFWSMENINKAASCLLGELEERFLKRPLRNYFLPYIDLLEKVPHELLMDSASVLRGIKDDPMSAIAPFVDEVVERATWGTTIVKQQVEPMIPLVYMFPRQAVLELLNTVVTENRLVT